MDGVPASPLPFRLLFRGALRFEVDYAISNAAPFNRPIFSSLPDFGAVLFLYLSSHFDP